MTHTSAIIGGTNRRLISLTIASGNVNTIVDLNKVIAIIQPQVKNGFTELQLLNGNVIEVIEHYQNILDKWVGVDEVDYTIEGEDEIL